MGTTDDPYLTRLAAAENRESGYSLADMRRLLDRIYAGVRQEKSRKLAETVQSALFQSLRKSSPEIQNRGVKTAPFIVLLSTEMPAILAEVSCLSNEEEARLLDQAAIPAVHRRGAREGGPLLRGKRRGDPGQSDAPAARKESSDEREERGPPRGDRPGHLEELDLGVQRPAPRDRELRRLAARHGGASGC